MEKDLIYDLNIVTSECFLCKETFKLYDVQKVGITFCKQCTFNNKFIELTTVSAIIKQIVFFAEKENQKVNDRLVVDISDLLKELQKTN